MTDQAGGGVTDPAAVSWAELVLDALTDLHDAATEALPLPGLGDDVAEALTAFTPNELAGLADAVGYQLGIVRELPAPSPDLARLVEVEGAEVCTVHPDGILLETGPGWCDMGDAAADCTGSPLYRRP